MDSRYAIDNTGYLLAFDRYGTSTFSAPTLRNSCQYTQRNVTHYRPETESYYRTETYKGTNVWSFLTFGIYRPTRTRQVLDYRTVQRPYTVVEISAQSTPGQIFLAGNCQVEANRCYVEGGSFIVGGLLQNAWGRNLYFQARTIDQFRGTVQANSPSLALSHLSSQGAQFRAGSGGLCIRSQGAITFVSEDRDHHVQLQTFVQPTEFAKRYAPLFETHDDGSVHVRSPEKETAAWDVRQMVTTKPLRTDQPINVMISPEAFFASHVVGSCGRSRDVWFTRGDVYAAS